MSFVVHSNIAPDKVEERSYQTSMVNGCIRSNTLLILPTGLGKTIVALRVAADFVDQGKVIILAPTKPLLDQHYNTFSNLMVGHSVCILSGNVAPQRRVDMFEQNDVIVATPQTVANDLTEGRYSLDKVSLVIFDEAHRSVGGYANVTVAEYCNK
ncbi:MAG: DEAD/DEAH box helicase, partial [Candidatus Methanomethylophilaceae archaeon]|nr:DEAD/DEAH box helicase [Candidatus Methanomethylophilaceae archaeon]